MSDTQKKYTAEERRQMVRDAIKNGGFYGTNDRWNSIVTIPGDNNLYRKRVETIIIKNKKEVFVKKRPDNTYVLPGGSAEKDIPDMQQAINECREEARINVRNIQSTGISYKKMDSSRSKTWAKDMPVHWDGYITDVYIGEFDSIDHRFVADEDLDPYISSGRFYSFKECFKFFRKEHSKALSNWIKENHEKEKTKDMEVKESYIGNYFKNKIFLKYLMLTDNRDVNLKTIEDLIDDITKEYKNSKKKGIDKKDKASLKKEEKNNDVEIYHSIYNLTLADRKQTEIIIGYSHIDSYTSGICYSGEDDNSPSIVVLKPSFFDEPRDDQVFTLLHEIGHAKLGHTKKSNAVPFGNENDSYRLRLAKRGKTMYPELFADAYAILHGAKLYVLIPPRDHGVDIDEEINYMPGDAENANRYLQAYKKYNKYITKRYINSTDAKTEAVDLLDDLGYSLSTYDLMNFAISEYVYENINLINESIQNKNYLYKFLNNLVIERFIDNDEHSKRFIYNEATKDLYKDRFNTEDSHFTSLESFVSKRDSAKALIEEYIDEYLCKYETVSIFENVNSNSRKLIYILEKARKRSKLEDSMFGIPELRKYPLESKKHVYSAIKLFGHYADTKYASELASNIFKAMKKYHISKDIIGEKNKLRNYM